MAEEQALTQRHLEHPPKFFCNGIRQRYERRGYDPFTFSGSLSLTGTLNDGEKPYFSPLEIEVGTRYRIQAAWKNVIEEDKRLIITKGDRQIVIPTPLPDIFYLYSPESLELSRYSELYFSITTPRYPGDRYSLKKKGEAVINLRQHSFWNEHSDPLPFIRGLVERFIYTGERALEEVCSDIEKEVAAEKKQHNQQHKKCCKSCMAGNEYDELRSARDKFDFKYIDECLRHPILHAGCEFKTTVLVD